MILGFLPKTDFEKLHYGCDFYGSTAPTSAHFYSSVLQKKPTSYRLDLKDSDTPKSKTQDAR